MKGIFAKFCWDFIKSCKIVVTEQRSIPCHTHIWSLPSPCAHFLLALVSGLVLEKFCLGIGSYENIEK